jgi:hypothetical protein
MESRRRYIKPKVVREAERAREAAIAKAEAELEAMKDAKAAQMEEEALAAKKAARKAKKAPYSVKLTAEDVAEAKRLNISESEYGEILQFAHNMERDLKNLKPALMQGVIDRRVATAANQKIAEIHKKHLLSKEEEKKIKEQEELEELKEQYFDDEQYRLMKEEPDLPQITITSMALKYAEERINREKKEKEEKIQEVPNDKKLGKLLTIMNDYRQQLKKASTTDINERIVHLIGKAIPKKQNLVNY